MDEVFRESVKKRRGARAAVFGAGTALWLRKDLAVARPGAALRCGLFAVFWYHPSDQRETYFLN